MIALLHMAISERFRGAARRSAIQIHVYFTLLTSPLAVLQCTPRNRGYACGMIVVLNNVLSDSVGLVIVLAVAAATTTLVIVL